MGPATAEAPQEESNAKQFQVDIFQQTRVHIDRFNVEAETQEAAAELAKAGVIERNLPEDIEIDLLDLTPAEGAETAEDSSEAPTDETSEE